MASLHCEERLEGTIDSPVYLGSVTNSEIDRVLINDARVLENMLNDEKEVVKEDYCKTMQSSIAPHMRKIVTDWMLEVCEDQNCQPEVFFLSVNYLDRFLSKVNISKHQFQLVASTCLLLASKFSQVLPLTTEQLVIYTDNSITTEELRLWEMHVLNTLQWELSSVTTHSFLEHFIPRLDWKSKTNADRVERYAESIAAMAATEYQFMLTNHSMIAAAALSAAVMEDTEDVADVENMVKKLAKKINSNTNEIGFYIHHLQQMLKKFSSSSCPEKSLPTFSSLPNCCQSYEGIHAEKIDNLLIRTS